MAKYVKKPVVIEAIKWEGQQELEALPVWLQEAIKEQTVWFAIASYKDLTPIMLIETLEGTHRAQVGDYIIQGVKGELYPCKPDIFESTYEEVLEAEEEKKTTAKGRKSKA